MIFYYRNIRFLFFNFVILGYGGYALQKELKYKHSFTKEYAIDDLGDKRIIFYNEALIKYSKAFVLAEGMYEIFERDVKRDLALSCIEVSLAEHNQEDWLEKGIKFRKNARNIPLKTEVLIQKYKAQEKYLSDRFYQYDFNDVHHIVESLASPYRKELNKNTCDKQLSVERMYQRFIRKYIGNREEALANYQKSLAKNSSKDKAYYTKAIREGEEWLNLLYQNTDYNKEEIRETLKQKQAKIKSDKIAEREKSAKIWEKKEIERKKKLRILASILYQKNKNIDKINTLLKETIYPDLQPSGEITGKPLLYEALKQNDIQAVQILLDYGVYPLGSRENDAYIFSSATQIEAFKLIVKALLNDENPIIHYPSLFTAIRFHASYEKIEVMLEYLPKDKIDERMYFNMLEHSLEFCNETKTIALVLSKQKNTEKDSELLLILQKPSYKCENKKEIEALFDARGKK